MDGHDRDFLAELLQLSEKLLSSAKHVTLDSHGMTFLPLRHTQAKATCDVRMCKYVYIYIYV